MTTSKNKSGEMDLLEHIGELRRRLVFSIIGITVGSIFAYLFSLQLFELLTAPFFESFPKGDLIGTGVAEMFIVRLKVSVFAGVLLGSPVICYQIWQFVAPGLYEHEKKFITPFVVATSGLFLLGVSFCYYLVIPVAYDYFYSHYESLSIKPTIRISEHLSMMIKVMLGFGIIFELPIVAVLLARMGLIDHNSLIRWWRHAAVLIFLVAAFLTPPDVLSQCLMAFPMMVLYGLSIVLVKYTYRERVTDELIQTETKTP